MDKTKLGDRMKSYEKTESGRRVMPEIPVMARLDGRSFSKFTKGFERPYDKRMSDLMVDCTEYLVSMTNACIGYTQSDEISLTWLQSTPESEIFFAGKIQKMVSSTASILTAYFNANFEKYFGEPSKTLAFFDCRVWNVPSKAEAANNFLWREQDATKNSISMAARHYYSHKQLLNKNGSEMQEMLWQKGVNWNDYPEFFKRGTYVQRTKEVRAFTAEEIDKLPAKHAAKTNPNLEVERSKVTRLNMPPFSKVINKEGVIFNGEDPILGESND